MSKNDSTQKAFKVYNFIAGRGGKIEFQELIQHPSPLKSFSEEEAGEWLKEFKDLNDKEDVIEKPCFVVGSNCEGKLTVRLCVKTRLCQNYEKNGDCKHGPECLQFHICKGFLEGRCTNASQCTRSHDLLDKGNLNKLRKYRLDYLSNSSLRKVITNNIPYVCENYVNRFCENRFCPNIHVCSRLVKEMCEDREEDCPFKLSHDMQSPHNKRIFREYFVPQKYLLCNVLVSKETKIDVESKGKCKGKVNKLNNLNIKDGSEKVFSEYSKLDELPQNIVTNVLEDPMSKAQQQKKGKGKKDVPRSNEHEMLDVKKGLLPTPNFNEKLQPRHVDFKRYSSLPANTREGNPVKPVPLMEVPLEASNGLYPDFKEEFQNMLFPRDLKSQYQSTREGQGQMRSREANTRLSHEGRKWKSMDNFQSLSSGQTSLDVLEKYNKHGTGRGQSIRGIGTKGRGSWRGRGRGSLPFEKEGTHENISLDSTKEEVPSKPKIEAERGRKKTSHKKKKSRSNSTDGNSTQNLDEGEEDVKELQKNMMEFDLEDEEEKDLIDWNNFDDASQTSDLVDLNFDAEPGLSQLSEAQAMWDIFSQDQLYNDEGLQDEFLGCVSNPFDSSSLSESSNLVASERAVFNCILQEFGGIVSFSEISSRVDLFDADFKDQEQWFKDHSSSFLMFYGPDGHVVEIKTIVLRAKMCFKYCGKGCNNNTCRFFHVCKEYIAKGRCNDEVNCKRNHGFSDDHNKSIASKLFPKDHYSDKQLQFLVQSSSPHICLDYNNGQCKHGKHCTKIHICKKYGREKCPKGSCNLAHYNGLCTTATKRILDRFKIKNPPEKNGFFLAKTFLVCDDLNARKRKPNLKKDKKIKPESLAKSSYHISSHFPSHICLKFLLNKCDKGSKCMEHHCPMPYQWVYLVDTKWHMLNDDENVNLERFFCNESLAEAVITLTLISCSSSSSVAQTQQNESYFYKVDFKEMQIKSIDEQGPNFQVKRLSTESVVHIPGCPLATKWRWFWKGPDDKFTEYQPSEDSKEPTSATIEKHFLEGNSSYNFQITGSHSYRLYFKREPMMQKNLDPRYYTEREVQRRPQYVKKKDFENIISTTQKLPQEDSRQMPQLWTKMAEYQEFLLHPLKSQSKEFKEMKTRFLDSIKREVTINSIDRVQNPFMMEKYLRKKSQMQKLASVQSVDERFLFHGTSHLNIRPICKQNFDWRLYGKVTGNVYGEGAYFARDSHTSDCYCHDNEDGLRYMFVVKVLVGSYTKGNKNYKRPPPKDADDPHDLFDSCVDNVDDPKIFVVFDVDQYYPAYLIEYKRHDAGELQSFIAARQASSLPSASSYSYSGSSLSSTFYDPTTTSTSTSYHNSGAGASQLPTTYPQTNILNLASVIEREVDNLTSSSSSKKSTPQNCLVM